MWRECQTRKDVDKICSGIYLFFYKKPIFFYPQNELNGNIRYVPCISNRNCVHLPLNLYPDTKIYATQKWRVNNEVIGLFLNNTKDTSALRTISVFLTHSCVKCRLSCHQENAHNFLLRNEVVHNSWYVCVTCELCENVAAVSFWQKARGGSCQKLS